MGSKFCNINIQGVSLEDVRAAAPEHQAFACAPGWVTVVSPHFQWGRTQRYAKALSEAIPAPVLSTEYFDDDYVEFAVYREGQLMGRHVPVTYEDLRRSCGRAAAFMTAFGLSFADTPLLKKIFALRDCEESVLQMESLLGCPIFGIDEENPPSEAPDPDAARAFGGGLPAIQASKTKNPAKKDQPPYLFNDEGDCRNHGEFYCRSVIYYTGDADKVLKNVRRVIAMILKHHPEVVHEYPNYTLRMLKKGPITVVQNFEFGSTDACAGDFPRGWWPFAALAPASPEAGRLFGIWIARWPMASSFCAMGSVGLPIFRAMSPCPIWFWRVRGSTCKLASLSAPSRRPASGMPPTTWGSCWGFRSIPWRAAGIGWCTRSSFWRFMKNDGVGGYQSFGETPTPLPPISGGHQQKNPPVRVGFVL